MKLSNRITRLQKLQTPPPGRKELFVLYKIEKPITLVHAFRLAEGLEASIALVGTTITNEGETLLDESFPRWRAVPLQTYTNVRNVLKDLKQDGFRPVALEVSKQAQPYQHFKPEPTEPLAFFVGSEGSGLDKEVLGLVPDHIYIPMVGESSCFAAGMALAIVASHFAYVEGIIKK